MTELDALYTRLLHVGLSVVVRQAAAEGNHEWVAAEIEMLHNVPSLIGEENIKRHQYYWSQERAHYQRWASAPGREVAKSRMQTYYEPIWREMQPLLSGATANAAS